MESRNITFNRWLVGALAIGCFVAAGYMWANAPDPSNDAGIWRFWWGGFLRGGVVLVAFWFCLPTKTRPAAWASFNPLSATFFVVAILLTILRPKVGLPLLLLFLAVRTVVGLFRHRR